MSEVATFRGRVRECIETVESEAVWCAFDAVRFSERVNVIFGAADARGTDRRLSCTVEIIDPAFYFDPDRLPVSEANLADVHPFLSDFVEDLSEAIESATGVDSVGPFVYRGLEPGTAASSALFRATVGTAE